MQKRTLGDNQRNVGFISSLSKSASLPAPAFHLYHDSQRQHGEHAHLLKPKINHAMIMSLPLPLISLVFAKAKSDKTSIVIAIVISLVNALRDARADLQCLFLCILW